MTSTPVENGGTNPHPAEEQWAALAAGLAGPREADDLLAHAAGCDSCARLLKETVSFLADETGGDPANVVMENELLASLKTSGQQWRRETAERLAAATDEDRSIDIRRGTGGRENRGSRWTRIGARQWLAAAAAIVVVAGAAWWWKQRRDDPGRLLAQAYTAGRPFEYRLPDDGYGPVRQRRSGSVSTFDRPESLARAEAEIARQLKGSSQPSEALLFKGRAELLEGQYDSAIEDLTRSSELASPMISLGDLAVAYAARGDAEQRKLDYGHALDLLLQLLTATPRNTEALFNLAMIYEKLSMVEESIETWKRLLDAEPAGPWASEARRRLQEVEAKKKARADALKRTPDDPAAFLSLAAMSSGGQPGRQIEMEYFQTAFWRNWLPNAAANPVAERAAGALADIWAARFRDRSLRDALDAARGRNVAPLLAGIGKVMADNTFGRNDEGLAGAEKLAPQLAAAGQTVPAARVSIELAYAHRRATHHEPCLAITSKLLADLDKKPYPWLTGRTHLEHSICLGRAGDMGSAQQEREQTVATLTSAGLLGLALQAQELVTSVNALSGNSGPVWERAPKALELFWSTAAAEARAQQALYDMGLAAKALGWKQAAIAAQDGAVRATVRWRNRQLEAPNRLYLASLMQLAGQTSEARKQIDIADQLFAQLPPGPTTTNMRLAGELRKAENEAAGGDATGALADLDALSRQPNFSSVESRLREKQTRGVAFMTLGREREAAGAFREAVVLADDYVPSFPQPLSRIAASELALESRRGLVEIALRNSADPAVALREWEERWNEVTPARPRAVSSARVKTGQVALTYAILPAGVAAWVTTTGGIEGRLLALPVARLEATVLEFHRLCASPRSDVRELRAAGHALYASLIEPFASQVNPARQILIEPDQWLASLPFGTLVDDRGDYLLAHHSIGVISSLADLETAEPLRLLPDSPSLIVSAPRAGARSGLPYLSSAEREATEVAARMTAPVILDASATAADVIHHLGRAEVFHFAGHGWANGGNAALILGPDSAGGSRFLAAADLAAGDWRQCRLAVLSACMTASGEERGPVNPQSIVRALLAAGAKRVMASRWSIDGESTRELMRAFYGSLFSGEAPIEALWQASETVRRKPAWEHPYYWAAFDVFGPP